MFKRILAGFGEFSKNLSKQDRDFFSQLAEGQNPQALLITCSDSRIVPQLFTQTGPGDLFMVRNVGNIIPRADESGISKGDLAEMSAVEYAVKFLQTEHLIVCGHSDCGAMKALSSGDVEESEAPHLKNWLDHAHDTLEDFQHDKADEWDELSQLSQFHVIRQLEHLQSYKFVREKLEAGTLTLHGWFFNIPEAALYVYDPEGGHFFSLIQDDE